MNKYEQILDWYFILHYIFLVFNIIIPRWAMWTTGQGWRRGSISGRGISIGRGSLLQIALLLLLNNNIRADNSRQQKVKEQQQQIIKCVSPPPPYSCDPRSFFPAIYPPPPVTKNQLVNWLVPESQCAPNDPNWLLLQLFILTSPLQAYQIQYM